MKDDCFEGSYLSGLLIEQVKKNPDNKAYIFFDADFKEETVTNMQLYKRACYYAGYLRSMGIGDGDRCMLLFRQGIDFVVAFFACSILKAIPVPLKMPSKVNRLSRWEKIAQETETTAILTSDKRFDTLKKLFNRSEVLKDIKMVYELQNYENDTFLTYNEEGNEIAFIQFTSGSTESPKGIMVTQSALLNNLKQIQRILEVGKDAVMVIWLPYYHDMGLIGGFLLSVYAGYPLIFTDPMNFISDPVIWAKAIARYRATHTGAPNFSYNLMAEKLEHYRKKDIMLETLKCAFCGSEPVNTDTMHRFGTIAAVHGFKDFNIFSGYGLGEGSLIVSGYVRSKEKMSYIILDKKDLSLNKVNIIQKGYLKNLPAIDRDKQVCLAGSGFVIAEHKIEIIDAETKEALGANRIGEIKFTGKSVTKGYWGKKEITDETFGTDRNGERTLLTGDLGFLDETGEIFITGRKKELMIINGCNYYPQDIERTAFSADENLCENGTAAFSIQYEDGEEKLVVAQEVKLSGIRNPQCNIWAAKIRTAVAKEHNLQIEKIIFIPKMHLPRTSSGKIQRLKARQTEISGTWKKVVGVSEFKLDYKALERECVIQKDYFDFVETLVSGILGSTRKELEYTRPFTEMGFNSIMLVLMCRQINKYLKLDLQPQVLFSYNTVDTLSRYLFALKNNDLMKKRDNSLNEDQLERMSYNELIELLNKEIGD